MEFDQFAASYSEDVERVVAFSGRGHDFFLAAKVAHLLALARARCGAPRDLTALDVGCGTGVLTGMLAPHLRRLYGTDIAALALREGARHAPSCGFVRYDGTLLPYRDGAFDFAYSVCVLHHVPVAARAGLLREMRRVVRPGGMVAFFEHNPWNPLTRYVVSRCCFDRDAVLLRCAELRGLLRQAGLREVDHAYILPFPWRSGFWRSAEAGLRRLPVGTQYWVAGRQSG